MLQHERTVEDKELLKGSRGRDTAGAVRGRIGEIVQPQQIVQLAAFDRAVDGSPAVVRITQLLRRAAEAVVVERTGDGEHCVAPGFHFQPVNSCPGFRTSTPHSRSSCSQNST